MSSPRFHVLDIVRGTTVDGPGFRTAIYLAGCSHRCVGCHNPQSWNPLAGCEMTLDDIMTVVKEEDFDVTLTGGDPLYDPASTLQLLKAVTSEGYGVWLYTGFTIEQINRREDYRRLLPYLDAIVEGPFVQALKDTDLPFRGSSNQRIIRFERH